MVLPEQIRMETSAAGERWAYAEGDVLKVGAQISEGQAAKFLETGQAVAHDASPPPEEHAHEADETTEAATVVPAETAALRTGKAAGRPRRVR